MTAGSRPQPAAEQEEAGEPKATSSVAAGTAEKRKGESGDRNTGDARCSTSHLFPRSRLNGFAHLGFRKWYEAAPSIGVYLHRFPPGMMLKVQYLCPFYLEQILSNRVVQTRSCHIVAPCNPVLFRLRFRMEICGLQLMTYHSSHKLQLSVLELEAFQWENTCAAVGCGFSQ